MDESAEIHAKKAKPGIPASREEHVSFLGGNVEEKGRDKESELEEPGGDIAGHAVNLSLGPVSALGKDADLRADRNGADHYAKDAMETVRYAVSLEPANS